MRYISLFYFQISEQLLCLYYLLFFTMNSKLCQIKNSVNPLNILQCHKHLTSQLLGRVYANEKAREKARNPIFSKATFV